MKKIAQAGGVAAAALSTFTAVPCLAEVNEGEPIYDSYGQVAYTGQEYYQSWDMYGNSYFIFPELDYGDAGLVYSQWENYDMYVEGANAYTSLQPDFENVYAWSYAPTGYNTPELWGQCTWFAWCRFYEIYGFDPGFTGDGWQCAYELVNCYPDLFYLDSTPVSGAVFSSSANTNHVGIVLWSDGYNMIIQEGNIDGDSNGDWNEATEDYWTREVTVDQMNALYDDVVYANPVEGMF